MEVRGHPWGATKEMAGLQPYFQITALLYSETFELLRKDKIALVTCSLAPDGCSHTAKRLELSSVSILDAQITVPTGTG